VKINLTEKKFNINKAAFIVGTFTIISRIIGLFRDRLFASKFGAGDILDIYYSAFRIPDFIYNLLILGTLSIAFIPIFTEWLNKDKKIANRIANTILNLSFIVISASCLILYFFAEPLTKYLVPGFSSEKLTQTISLTKLFLISPIIFTISNIFGCILNASKKFLIVSLAPILYNLGIIFGLIFLYPKFGIIGLGLGVIIGAVLHLVIQSTAAFATGFYWQPILDIRNESVKKISRLFIPKIFGMDNGQISLLISSSVGSILSSGSISVFNLANNLQAVPIGIFAISISVTAFPLFSENFSNNNEEKFSENLLNSMVKILFFLIPISLLILVLRAHIVRLAFGSGEFDWQDTILTFRTMGVFCLSIFAQGLSPLLARAFYARQNTIIPVILNLFSMALNAILAYFLGKTYGVVGIAVAFSISAVFNCLCLFIGIRIKIKNFQDKKLFFDTFKILFCSVTSGLSAYAVLYLINPFVNTHTGFGLLLQFIFSATIATIIFFYTAYLQNLSQAVWVINFLKRKL
jgi:putative peptidoglycan lipid II flippase